MNTIFKKITVLLLAFLMVSLTLINVSVITIADDSPAIRSDLGTHGFIFTIEDYGLDENNDTSYDNLYLSLGLDLNSSGKYTIYASMNPSGINASDTYSGDFTSGKNYVELSFSGRVIYNSAHDGPYIITISIYKTSELLKDFKYETENYNFEEFNPNPVSPDLDNTSIEVINNTIMLKTEIFVAVIYELSPKIIFYYTTDEGKLARFKVTYQRIICFDDNGDDRFQSSELRYSADLQNSHWSSRKVLMENFNSFDFSVQSVVSLRNLAGQLMNTKLKLTFHYASPSFMNGQKTGQKFDIGINVLGGALKGITHIALEHTLEDEQANHLFMEKDSDDHASINFITHEGEERGYYSWKKSFETKTGPGMSDEKDVTYSFEPTSDTAVMKLYLNYQYSPEYIELFHDPEVGVDPENPPVLPGEKVPKIINHQILIYLIVAIIAAVIMFGNIYRQRSKKKKER